MTHESRKVREARKPKQPRFIITSKRRLTIAEAEAIKERWTQAQGKALIVADPDLKVERLDATRRAWRDLGERFGRSSA